MSLVCEKKPIMNGQEETLNIHGACCTDIVKPIFVHIIMMMRSARYYVRGVVDKEEERLL